MDASPCKASARPSRPFGRMGGSSGAHPSPTRAAPAQDSPGCNACWGNSPDETNPSAFPRYDARKGRAWSSISMSAPQYHASARPSRQTLFYRLKSNRRPSARAVGVRGHFRRSVLPEIERFFPRLRRRTHLLRQHDQRSARARNAFGGRCSRRRLDEWIRSPRAPVRGLLPHPHDG